MTPSALNFVIAVAKPSSVKVYFAMYDFSGTSSTVSYESKLEKYSSAFASSCPLIYSRETSTIRDKIYFYF